MKPTLFANGLIINEGFRFIGSVVIDGLMFSRVDYGRIDLREVDREVYDVVDCEGKMVIPGVIDEHVHFRDPGLTEKGDLATESRAAIAGGVTSFFDMPNTRPATTTIEAWEEKMQRAAAVSAANYAFFMGVANNNIDQLLAADPTRVPGAKLFLGSSTGNMLVDNDSVIASLFRSYHGVIACHAESEQIIAANRAALAARYPEGIPLGLHSTLRSREACVTATGHAVELARRTNARLHVMHVTTADELSFFSGRQVMEKRITAETCPHYLVFDESSVEATGGLTKCNPAIKTDNDRKALLNAVRDGRIDIIATDHAPHLLSQKTGDALTAASGMPSVQFALPVMLQLARRGHFTYETVVEKMCCNPARLYNIDRRGFIRPDYCADLVIINPDCNYRIDPSDIISSCGWTPYKDFPMTFRVEQTWVNGRPAYINRALTGANPSPSAASTLSSPLASAPASPEGTPASPFTGLQTALPVRFSPLA